MIRAGLGFDAHAFDETRTLVLGGVAIPDAPGLQGHSDADVLTHAVADALLGAAGEGDLGAHFPATDVWRDASSVELLAASRAVVSRAGWDVVNVDATVVAEAPPLSSHRSGMIANLAAALGADPGCVSVKATTSDGLGFTGRREGIAAMAVVLVERAG